MTTLDPRIRNTSVSASAAAGNLADRQDQDRAGHVLHARGRAVEAAGRDGADHAGEAERLGALPTYGGGEAVDPEFRVARPVAGDEPGELTGIAGATSRVRSWRAMRYPLPWAGSGPVGQANRSAGFNIVRAW